MYRAAKQTHRSAAQEREDKKVQAKVARQEPLADGDQPNFGEVAVGGDNGKNIYENNARYGIKVKV